MEKGGKNTGSFIERSFIGLKSKRWTEKNLSPEQALGLGGLMINPIQALAGGDAIYTPEEITEFVFCSSQ